MSYRAGVGSALGDVLGWEPGPPRVICDGCGAIKVAMTARGGAPEWLLNLKAPPGWKMTRTEKPDGMIDRVDLCPACKRKEGDR